MTLKKRINDLIEEAGGITAFAEKTWPKQDPKGTKGKVGKWSKGKAKGTRGGMSATEAADVAKAFNRRAGWLLFGEQPEHADVVVRDLYSELAEKTTRRLNEVVPPRLPDTGYEFEWQVDGRALYEALVARLEGEAEYALGEKDIRHAVAGRRTGPSAQLRLDEYTGRLRDAGVHLVTVGTAPRRKPSRVRVVTHR